MSTELTTYAATDLSEVDNAEKELAKQREDRKRRDSKFKFQVGRNVIRIMPPRADYPRRFPIHSMWVHYVPNPAAPDKGGRPFACPTKNANQPCPVCAVVQSLRRSGDPVDKDAADRIRAKQEWYVNMVDMAAPDKGVQVVSFGVTIYEKLIKLMKTPTDDDPVAVGDITHPDTGYNVIVEKTVGDPKKLKETTRYDVHASKKPSAIANREWLSQLHDLRTAAVESISPQQVQDIMDGKVDPNESAPVASVAAPTADDDLYEAPPKGGAR